jgi:acyl transferase domain-containing protein/3-hydroxymyristoyl/3-hydroxydecanoyl-(acyl carrier protein) dehydratase/1-acyl-sn-glycerol-3-phosphate acyltransferase
VTFEPIAIVGQACTLPGALTPEALWVNALRGDSALTSPPEGRWRLPAWHAMGKPGAQEERAWSDVGGYVRGFEAAFDPRGLRLPEAELRGLDPVFQWTLHTARIALRSAGMEGPSLRAGLVLGNLSFPTASMSRYAESVWLEAMGKELLGGRAAAQAGVTHPDARNRFMSGLPAHLTAQALGLGAGAFALDAACASSLYAIKLACDKLHDRAADVMLAGAVNAADSLFLHIGFSALSAMSRTGQSRPFHREADGLVPSEGAVFFTLQRLDDARAAGRTVLGIIRGIGLSNDGRGRGLLAPSEEGQVRAMRLAYASAGITPAEVGFVECHATGTPVGDATEVRSLAEVFAGCREVPIGSLKSNLGHLITAAGGAGLIKILGSFTAETIAPTIHAGASIAELAGSPVRLVTQAEPWRAAGRRIAAISAFGFGGNNAHLLVEQDDGKAAPPRAAAASPTAKPAPIAVISLGARIGDTTGRDEAARALLSGAGWGSRREAVTVELEGLRFPPRDLEQTLPQQLLVLEAGREAIRGLSLPRDRTAVLIGMGADPEVARYGARWRLPAFADAWATAGLPVSSAWIEAARDAVQEQHGAAGVVGAMPNIPANRLSSQLDLAGPSFTVSSEELSGVVALQLAARALRSGEIDAALVGAVDLADQVVHRQALSELGLEPRAGDAAVALVLKRLADVRKSERVLAILDEGDEGASSDPTRLRVGDGATDLDFDPFVATGKPHAATGLVHVAAAVLALHHGARPAPGRAAMPWVGSRRAEVTTQALGDQATSIHLRGGGPAAPLLLDATPQIHVFAGADREAALRAVAEGREGLEGPARAVIVASSREELDARRADAIRAAKHGAPMPEGVILRERPVAGELAFVFAGAAAAYPSMGRALALALPDVMTRLAARLASLPAVIDWIHGAPREPRHPLEQLWASSFLCQLHAEITRGDLGLCPSATIGYSSGESNALFAMGAWRDLDAMMHEAWTEPLLTSELVGDYSAARRLWARSGVTSPAATWAAWVVAAPVADVRRALEGEPLAHLTIINTAEECVIGGESSACDRVVAKLGKNLALPLSYAMASHCPEVAEAREAWITMHRRATFDVPGVRFYSAGAEQAFAPTADAAAMAITGQAVDTLDFPRVIERAYADGVRVFVEHGPRGLCSRWIARILGAREHLVVPLDVAGQQPVRQLVSAVAQLIAAGVPVAADALLARLAPPPPARGSGLTLTVRAHPPDIHFPTAPAMQLMPPAPVLPPVLADNPAPRTERSFTGRSTTREDAPAGFPSPRLPGFARLLPLITEPDQALTEPIQALTEPIQALTEPIQALTEPIQVLTEPIQVLTEPERPLTSPAEGHHASIAARGAAVSAGIAAAHRAYVEAQGAVHARFLALSGSLLSRLAAAPTAASAPAPSRAPQLAAPPLATPQLAAPPPAAPQRLDTPTLVTARPAAALASAPPRAPVAAFAPAPISAPASTVPATALLRAALPGPKLSRKDLEVLASGSISSIFGPRFAGQDQYARQCRMPEPPLLLADRVTGIDAVPGSMDTGTIWTETDVKHDSWYLHQGRMPTGIVIESGQADLLLISWLGIDALNKGERVYRLLGCEATYHGELPKPGDTLVYEIHIDGHAEQGDVRLFFFHYDCRINGELRISVRNGQAGFFTYQELANSGGVLWDADGAPHETTGPLDPPQVVCEKRSFTEAEVLAFSEGDAYACFGRGFERAQTHVRTPRIQDGPMRLLDRVTDFDPRGGPWGRGYLRAEARLSPDDWFLQGHFKNDPCMPGTLILEACVQAMAFYLCAMGYSVDRDGWRFEPVPGQKSPMRCRGQASLTSREIVYEIFVHEVTSGPIPSVKVDMLCTVDGLKAFHGERVGIRLVPAWPLDDWREAPVAPQALHRRARQIAPLGGIRGHVETKPIPSVNGFAFDYASLIACAWGKPSQAFGPMYAPFDGTRRVARLPGPPYHFITRIIAVEGPIGVPQPGAAVEVEYDVPHDAWYFAENGARTMPFCVLLEAALQPCGWLASYIGSALTTEDDLLFRNLDGTGTVFEEITPESGTLRTHVKVVEVSQSAGMIIETFEVECFVGEAHVYTLRTVFGFFPKSAFDNQVGLPVSAEARARVERPATSTVNLAVEPPRYFGGAPRLASTMLSMLDRITAFEPKGGLKGLGYGRAEKDVDPGEWSFKAHFFQDPVQPGSLGLEAILQLLQAWMIDAGDAEGIPGARFEPIAVGRPMTWKYRGQVVPKNRLVTVEIDITERGADDRGRFALAEGSLWVDGKRIYGAKNLGMRVVAGPERPPPGPPPSPPSLPPPPARDLASFRGFWRAAIGVGPWPIEDLYIALVERFLGRIVIADPVAFSRVHGRGCLYVANHQVALESLIFIMVASAIAGTRTMALAKAEHQESWLGRLITRGVAYPGVTDPGLITFFDREDHASFARIAEQATRDLAASTKSVLVHVEGTRAISCRTPVTRLGASVIDMALAAGAPIVPVRFARGLPESDAPERLDFPLGYGRQDIHFGAPIEPSELARLPLKDRKDALLTALNTLGPGAGDTPSEPDPGFAAQVEAWRARTGCALEDAVFYATLAGASAPESEGVQRLLEGARTGKLVIGSGEKDRWLGEFARSLFGSADPTLRIQHSE